MFREECWSIIPTFATKPSAKHSLTNTPILPKTAKAILDAPKTDVRRAVESDPGSGDPPTRSKGRVLPFVSKTHLKAKVWREYVREFMNKLPQCRLENSENKNWPQTSISL